MTRRYCVSISFAETIQRKPIASAIVRARNTTKKRKSKRKRKRKRKGENTVAERNRGVVKWFNSSKGYGFIAIDGRDEDIFVHFSSISMDGYKRLNEGDVVEFDIGKGKKGAQAENVVLVQTGNPQPKSKRAKAARASERYDEFEES